MYSKSDLSNKAHIELIEIAKELGVPRATRMEAQELIYKILDFQANNPSQEEVRKEEQNRMRPHRTRLKPIPMAESNMKNYKARVQNRPRPRRRLPLRKPSRIKTTIMLSTRRSIPSM